MPGHGGHAEQRADRPPHSPAAHQDEPLAAIGELVGELRRHTAAQRMPDHGDAVDLEDAQEVAHAVGEARHGVVGPRLLGASVAEEVRGDDRVVLGQLLDDRPPGVGAVADAVDEEECRARPGLDVGPPVAVDGDVPDREGAFAPDAGPIADLRRVDRTGVVGDGIGERSCDDLVGAGSGSSSPPWARVSPMPISCARSVPGPVRGHAVHRRGPTCPRSVDPVNSR